MLRSSLKQPEKLGRFDKVVLRISSPLQAVASWAIGGIGGLWNDYVWLVRVEDENDELRALNLKLREELGHAQRAAVDLEIIEELVGLKRRIRAETAAAHVIASSINTHFRVNRLRIDRGEGQIEVGMPVISAAGLAGRILDFKRIVVEGWLQSLSRSMSKLGFHKFHAIAWATFDQARRHSHPIRHSSGHFLSASGN